MESIIQKDRVCFLCGTTNNLHCHHVLGAANRHLSEKYGLKVYLCQKHHTGLRGIHFNKDLDEDMKKLAQKCFETEFGAEMSFREVFGKDYIGEDEQSSVNGSND